MDEQIDATENSSDSTLGEAIAATPEVQQEAQEQVAESVSEKTETPEQVPFNEHPRFKELIEERNWYRQQLERQQVQPQQQQPTTDEFAGMTPEEERFWRAVDARAEKKAEQKFRQVNPMLDAGIRELTNMKVQQFRDTHKDIKPDSPEELRIAQKINMGYLPEDAYRAVMWDRKSADAEKQANSQIKQKMEAKKQANVEQSSIPSGVNSHTKEKLTLRQRIERDAKEMGL
jgi:hypothetical protein